MPSEGFRTYVLLGVLVWLSSFPVILRDLTPSAPGQWDFQVLLFPGDIALAAVIVIALPRLFRGGLRAKPLVALAGLVWVALAIAWVFHPSLRGGQTLFRWAGVVATAELLDRDAAVLLTGGWAVFESLLGLAQKVRGSAVGLGALGESDDPFVRFGHALAPFGTLIHTYLLAGLALLGGSLLAAAARQPGRRWLLIPAAVAIAPVGFTYSRTALIGLALILVCFAVARFPAAVLVLALGAGVPALVWSNGWVARGDVGSSATGNGLDTGRGTLIHQAVSEIGDHPITGVGPGRYVIALRNAHVDPRASGGALKPVHNLPLLAGAEGGLLAGLAMTALLGVAGLVALRGGAASVAVYLGFLPFCLLDHFAYTYPQGLVMAGLWLGAIGAARVPTGRGPEG